MCPICRSDVRRRLRLESVPVRRAKKEKGGGLPTALAEKMKLNATTSKGSESVGAARVHAEPDAGNSNENAHSSGISSAGVRIPIPPSPPPAEEDHEASQHSLPSHLPPLRVDMAQRSGSTDTDSGSSTEELLTVRRSTEE